MKKSNNLLEFVLMKTTRCLLLLHALILYITSLLHSCSPVSSDNKLSEGRILETSKAMVVSAHPEASRIGAGVLLKGGNAVDAAVATEFALAVCYPEAGNIGGGGFMLVRTRDGETEVIDYREKAASAASRDMFTGSDGIVIEGASTATHLASGVPGTVDGMLTAHKKYGKLPFREVVQPAIDLAGKGFRLTGRQASDLNGNRRVFTERNPGGTAFVKDSLWKEGDLLVQSDLAETLKRIREEGRDGFYSGKTAGMIVNEMNRGNGIISGEDLASYRAVTRKALNAEYRGYKIITVPPPSSGGIILLQVLGMTEKYPLGEWGFNSPLAVHLVAEAERRAFADRAEYMGDPEFMDQSTESLLEKGYLESRMISFDESKASLSGEIKAGIPQTRESLQTTHYSIVDQDGNAVAATTTLNDTFGSSIVVAGAGFLLNNQMDDFSVKPGYPNIYGLVGGEVNAIAPGKRMLSSMTPVIVEKDGKLFLVAGSPGGSTIPTTVFQVITNVIDHDMKLSEAVDAGRFHHQWLPDQIIYEKSRIDSSALNILAGMGHNLRLRSSIGRVSAVMVMATGGLSGAGDSRGYNICCGY